MAINRSNVGTMAVCNRIGIVGHCDVMKDLNNSIL